MRTLYLNNVITFAVPPGLRIAVVQPFKHRFPFYERTYLTQPSVLVTTMSLNNVITVGRRYLYNQFEIVLTFLFF